MLISVMDSEGRPQRHVLVDCGKTFQDAAERHLPKLGVRGLEAVLLTHGHADCVLGLDSLREVQLAAVPPDVWTLDSSTQVFATKDTIDVLTRVFPYMLPGGSDGRVVGGLEPREISDGQCFTVLGSLQVRPLRVLHGGDYVCMGFAFGGRGEFVYLSDVSTIPPETLVAIKQCDIQVLIIDALLKSSKRFSHFGLDQAKGLIRDLKPKRSFLIGMACEFEHERDNKELRREFSAEGLEVGLSYDGLCIDLNVQPL